MSIFFIITGGYRFIRSLSRYRKSQDEISGKAFIIKEEMKHLKERRERFINKRKVDSFGVLLGFFVLTLGLTLGWSHIIIGSSISLLSFSAILLIFDLFGQFRTLTLLDSLDKFKTNS